MQTHGQQKLGWTASDSISCARLLVVSYWIAFNRAAIIDFWDGAIDIDELLAGLRRLP